MNFILFFNTVKRQILPMLAFVFAFTFMSNAQCPDPTACNYDFSAPFDDGSCTYPNECGFCENLGSNAEEYLQNGVSFQDLQCFGYSTCDLIVAFSDFSGDSLDQSAL